ncbi:hypothetical protein HYH03_000263 [Edaphochlamys debaryana]|uniref:Uncharacterized protein n=1 Tax=Edaphochlamys debaryana TaxID=47281 RepID=A0A836C715_9CHLO|nr:hypothetical protein HYH03_000263 [Edaphochlamys debaryana]|eukprot:KAG2501763.1 hypothetical protein HYH03_000263 [Edaphochlamys debaryana]
MSRRQDRGKPAFPPDHHNLGGVQQLIDTYRDMQTRIHSMQPPTVEVARARYYPENMSMSQRLSHNRAVRKAAVDPTGPDHINNIYHMHRRMEAAYSRTERLKDPWDTTVHPVYIRRAGNAYLEMLKDEMNAWRPMSAPAWARPGPQERHPQGDRYAGWSVRESTYATYPSSRYAEARRVADASTYKRAIMAEILDTRMYREADLRKLFKAYIKLAPLGDKETVAGVVEELKRELDVR